MWLYIDSIFVNYYFSKYGTCGWVNKYVLIFERTIPFVKNLLCVFFFFIQIHVGLCFTFIWLVISLLVYRWITVIRCLSGSFYISNIKYLICLCEPSCDCAFVSKHIHYNCIQPLYQNVNVKRHLQLILLLREFSVKM